MASRGYLIGAGPPCRLKQDGASPTVADPIQETEVKKKIRRPKEHETLVEFVLKSQRFAFMKGAPPGTQGRTYKRRYTLSQNRLSRTNTYFYSDRFGRISTDFDSKNVSKTKLWISQTQSKNIVKLLNDFSSQINSNNKPGRSGPESTSFSVTFQSFVPSVDLVSGKTIKVESGTPEHDILDSTAKYLDSILE